MRKRAFTIWETAALLTVLAISAAMVLSIVDRQEKIAYRNSCQGNLKLMGVAFMQYNSDYDGMYPPVSSEGTPWSSLAETYLRKYHCPMAQGDKSNRTCDYFYNSRLVGTAYNQPQSRVNLAYPAWTILLGDGIAGGPLDAHLSKLPESWRTDSGSPAMRHEWMANYVFADSHVKLLKVESIDDGPRRKAKGGASFAVQ